ncbi:MAG: hypothetical protein NTY31_00440 [Candidatus Falkowbacteria bacterium]|nr:hypothetical protein [Candidatus Falkowbacteria bacterium]
MKLKNKKTLTIILPLIAVIGIFLFGHSALAAWDWVISIVAGFLGVFIWMLGVILVIVIKGLILIASYQNFIGSPAVTLGWVIVRDICNMFFVVVLLIIAFGTILHLEEYSYKKWLPKLILMAVLINFSKTICGLMIDAAQIVMLTFVNAFKDVGGANLTDILGLSDIVTLAKTEGTGATLWTVVGAYGLGFIYLLIAIVTIVTMMMMLVMRLVMIWLYVVLSPLAYLLSAFPGGQKYASQWWDEFVKNLIVGPVLAFFIWLSFAALQTYNQSNFDSETTKTNESAKADISNLGNVENTTGSGAVAASNASTPGFLIQYVIAIGMLLGGLKISQEIGGAAGSMAGKGMAAIQKGQGIAMGAGVGLAKWGGKQLGDLRDIASEKLGVDLNVVAGERRRREQVTHNRGLRQARIRKNVLEQAEEGKTWVGRKAALLSTGDVAWQNILDGKIMAGSPKKTKDNIDKIKAEEQKKENAMKEVADIDQKSSRVVTVAEDRENKNKIKNLDEENNKLSAEKHSITSSTDYQELINKETTGSLTENDTKNLTKKKARIEKIDEKIGNNQEEVKNLNNKDDVVADQNAKDAKLAVYQTAKQAPSKKIVTADEEIKKAKDILRKNKLSEVQSARADVNAKMEAEANKKIANFANPDQLIGIYKEAEEQHDEGLMGAAYKKLAKTSNYNELNKELNIGTGYDGMIEMSKRLQTHGGMTEQDARALVAEIGEIAKTVNHFEAFGAMTMNSAGQWDETGKDKQEAAILAEKSKLQVQQFVRMVNRLGTGSYRNGQPHDAEHWDLSRSTIALFASKDKSYRDELEKTGNINTIQFIGANKKNLEALERAGATKVAQIIREICDKAKSGGGADVSNPEETIRNTIV